jgi:hypothetical protein
MKRCRRFERVPAMGIKKAACMKQTAFYYFRNQESHVIPAITS